MHIFKSIYNGDRTLEDVEKEQEKLAVDLGRINQGPSYYKSFKQLDTIEKLKISITQEKKLSKYLMITLKICLKVFLNQNRVKDLKH